MTNARVAEEFFQAPAIYPVPIPMETHGPGVSGSEYPPQSSPWWLHRLLGAMERRNVRLARLRSYYDGTNQTWHLAAESHRNTFGTRFQNLRSNLAQPVVEIPEQRMSVIGVDLEGDEAGSDEAWRIWQANRLDAASSEAHLHVLSVGECPVIVGPGDGAPVITVEDPMQVYVETGWVERRRRLAGIKQWVDDEGRRTAVLYLPDRIEWWRTEARDEPGRPPRWRQIEGLTRRNPFGEVPIVTLRNRRGRAEHEGILELLDLYFATLYNMATAAHHLAYRQRYATGVVSASEDRDEETGEVARARAQSGPDQILTSDDPESKFGTLEASDLAPFIRQLDAIRGDIGTVTHTPHRLLFPPPTSVPPTGESVRFQDYPLTAKIRRIENEVGDGWEDVLRLAFRVSGDAARGTRMDMETVWADPELQAESVHVDALSKMAAMGVPMEELWRRLGATPQQIRRWKAAQPVPPASPAPTTPEVNPNV